MIQFNKAVKYEAKGRVALIGPAGSGKSFTALTLARLLAGPNGKIAAVDTEHGSLSKYADMFDFDVVELSSYSPDNFMEALKAAEAAKYDVFVADSLSHFWMGKDGALEFVDVAAKRSSSRDGMAGWKEFRPHERAMVDAMIASPMHVVCTMRTKTAYEEHVNDKGKKVRVKIGLAPVQREGLEYEFDVVGLMDEDNTFVVDKTRCPQIAGKAITRPKADDFVPFRDWLNGATPVQTPQAPPPAPVAQQASPSPSPAPQAQHFSVMGSRVNCFALAVELKTARNGKEFIALKMNGKVENQQLAYCWHTSMFEALLGAKEQMVQFEYELSRDGKSVNILEVLSVGEQEYRDGKPYAENMDAEPSESLFITDADLPAEMIK